MIIILLYIKQVDKETQMMLSRLKFSFESFLELHFYFTFILSELIDLTHMKINKIK